MTFRSAAIAGALLCAAGQTAHAAATFALLDQIGGTVQMNAGVVDGVFDTDMDVFTDEAMESIHLSLSDSAIETEGFVTFVLLETDMGIAFATLVDEQLADMPPVARGANPNTVLMTSDAPEKVFDLTNDDGDDLNDAFVLGGRNQIGGEFEWNASGADEADAFAWTGFETGDFVGFSFTSTESTFTNDGLNEVDTFQFVSWDKESEAWEIVATAEFTVNDQYGFTAEIVPAPGSTAILLAGAVALTGRRRRG